MTRTISPIALSDVTGSGEASELLDVRTPAEYLAAHVPGARSIPLDRLKADALLAHHEKGQPLYVMCQMNPRAKQAIARLELAGSDDCILVDGGMQAWVQAGLPVHRGASTVLPLMRQVQIVAGFLAALGAVLALAVNIWFAILPLLIGCGLMFAGITGVCGMALLLAKMPWNQRQRTCAECRNPEGAF